jgi:hypothetical protein
MAEFAEFKPFNLGDALESGERIRMARSQNELVSQNMKREALYRESAKLATDESGRYDIDKHVGLLRQNGLPELADELEQAHMERKVKGLHYITTTAPMVRNQKSYDSWRMNAEKLDIIRPGEAPTTWDVPDESGLRGADWLRQVFSVAGEEVNILKGDAVQSKFGFSGLDPNKPYKVKTKGGKVEDISPFDQERTGTASWQTQEIGMGVDKDGRQLFAQARLDPTNPNTPPVIVGKPYTKGSMGASGIALLDDPEALDMAVTTIMYDPTQTSRYVVSRGEAGQATLNAINRALATKLKAAGMTPTDMVKLRSTYKGEVASQAALTKQKNALAAFEDLARFNGDRLLQLIEKVDDTGVPVIEGITRAVKKGVGNVDVAEFASVLNAYQTEAARILSNPNMTGVLTDSARHELQQIVAGNATAAQLKRVINRVNVEMGMRSAYIDEQLGTSRQTMAPVPDGAPQPPNPAVAPTAADLSDDDIKRELGL